MFGQAPFPKGSTPRPLGVQADSPTAWRLAARPSAQFAESSYTLRPVGRSRAAVLGLVLFLVGAASLGLLDATAGDDWPGWDEGWALVAFPLGVPLALYAGAGIARAERRTRVATIGTLAVWLWGAAVFVAWLIFGG